MGVKKRIVHSMPAGADELRKRLVVEWRAGEDNDHEPIIIEERARPHQPTHLYVIWSDWADLSLQDRSEIIMDAYEEVRGVDGVLDVSVAMGLTPDEAVRMGIGYAKAG